MNDDNNLKKPEYISIIDFVYDPELLQIYPETKVIWTNDDQREHTVTADQNDFSSEVLEPGDSFEHVFTNPGEFNYHCDIHPEEKGKILVNELVEEEGLE